MVFFYGAFGADCKDGYTWVTMRLLFTSERSQELESSTRVVLFRR